MLPADEIAVGANVAFGAPSEHEFAGREGEAMAMRLAANHFQAQFHEESFRGQMGTQSVGRIVEIVQCEETNIKENRGIIENFLDGMFLLGFGLPHPRA